LTHSSLGPLPETGATSLTNDLTNELLANAAPNAVNTNPKNQLESADIPLPRGPRHMDSSYVKSLPYRAGTGAEDAEDDFELEAALELGAVDRRRGARCRIDHDRRTMAELTGAMTKNMPRRPLRAL
jgi:hypothetical protein